MRRMRIYEQITPLQIFLAIVLVLMVVAVPVVGTEWTSQGAHASGFDGSGLPRVKSATPIFGPSTGKNANRIRPNAFIPGRQLPGIAGHAAQRAGRNVVSVHTVHANAGFATNVVVSSDTTPAPFGPEPRNGPQAAVDPTNPNIVLVAYNDYTPNGHGGRYVPGYALSTDGGNTWSQPQTVHGLLKVDGGAYDGAADPGVTYSANGNAYLVTTTFDDDDWNTAIYVTEMPSSSSSFGTPVKVVSYTDSQHVVEFARLTNVNSTTLYLTFNALSTTPQAPDSSLASAWTSRLYFTRSLDGGQTWSAPVAISAGQQDYWGVPAVNNTTLFVFFSGALGLEMVQSSDGGATWTAPGCVKSSSTGTCQTMSTVGEQRGLNEVYINPGPDAAVDPGSHSMYIVYDGGKVTMSSDNGATWSLPLDVLGSSYAPTYLASISVDPLSHTVSVGGYSSAGDASGNSFNYYYAQSSDGGNHFSSPILISSNASLPPAPAFGSIGRVSSIVSGGHMAHLFWTDTNGTGGNEQILSATVDVSQPLMGALKGTWDSGQSVLPWGLIFNASGTQNMGVGNYGQGGPDGIGTVSVSTSGGNWLSASISNAGNGWVMSVTASANGSNRSGSVTITSASGENSSITIPVQLLVTSPTPAFSLSGTTLSFTVMQGVDPPPQSIQINSLGATIDSLQIDTENDPVLYVASPGGPQNLTLNSGVPSGLVVQIVTSGLSVGPSSHQVTVSDGTTSLTLHINVTINAAPAQLVDPGSALSFNYHVQDAAPRAQSLTLQNSGGSTLHWQAMSDVSWISLGSTSGTVNSGNSQQLSVSINIHAMPTQTGTYIGHVIFGGDAQALNLPEVTSVYLVVSQPRSQISTTWYFAEGYVSSNFTEFLTLENPNSQVAHVHVTYLTQPVGQAPKPPFTLSYTVNSNTRYTVAVNNQPGVVQNDQISLVVNSDVPIVAERPMYFKYTQLTPNPNGGTDVVGATHESSIFFFPFVQFGTDQQIGSPTYGTSYVTYLTVLNRNTTPVNVTITYKGADSLYSVTHQVAATTRGTFSLASDFPLANSSYKNSYLYAESLTVTTDLPVVVELPSYFTLPKNGTQGALASGTDEVGAAAPQINWDFAEGFTGTNDNPFLTYLDLANPGDTAANATLTLAVTNGTTPLAPVTKQYAMPPQSSITIELNALVCPQGVLYCGYSIGEHVASSQPIVVDRQMYFNYQGTIPGSTAVVGSLGPQSQFYFAEGYTGTGFSEYLTIVNPATNSSAETVTIRYLIQGGTPKTINLAQPLQPGQRWTEIVNRDVGANQQVSVEVSANTGTLIVERPMYFNFHSFAFGGTDVIGYSPGN